MPYINCKWKDRGGEDQTPTRGLHFSPSSRELQLMEGVFLQSTSNRFTFSSHFFIFSEIMN